MKTPKNARLSLIYSDFGFKSEIHLLKMGLIRDIKIQNLSSDYIKYVETGNVRASAIRKYGNKDLSDKLQLLQEKYKLSDNEFDHYFSSNENVFDSPLIIDVPEIGADRLSVSISMHASFEDLKKAWPAIKDQQNIMHGKVIRSRLKGPNLSVLWAIHKARLAKIKYSSIANMINSNSLEGYELLKGNNRRWTEASVKQYYSDYREYVDKPTS
jgi:hypothetical protein